MANYICLSTSIGTPTWQTRQLKFAQIAVRNFRSKGVQTQYFLWRHKLQKKATHDWYSATVNSLDFRCLENQAQTLILHSTYVVQLEAGAPINRQRYICHWRTGKQMLQSCNFRHRLANVADFFVFLITSNDPQILTWSGKFIHRSFIIHYEVLISTSNDWGEYIVMNKYHIVREWILSRCRPCRLWRHWRLCWWQTPVAMVSWQLLDFFLLVNISLDHIIAMEILIMI